MEGSSPLLALEVASLAVSHCAWPPGTLKLLVCSLRYGNGRATIFNPSMSLKSFGIRREQLEVTLDGLCCEPQVVDADARIAPRLSQLPGQKGPNTSAVDHKPSSHRMPLALCFALELTGTALDVALDGVQVTA